MAQSKLLFKSSQSLSQAGSCGMDKNPVSSESNIGMVSSASVHSYTEDTQMINNSGTYHVWSVEMSKVMTSN